MWLPPIIYNLNNVICLPFVITFVFSFWKFVCLLIDLVHCPTVLFKKNGRYLHSWCCKWLVSNSCLILSRLTFYLCRCDFHREQWWMLNDITGEMMSGWKPHLPMQVKLRVCVVISTEMEMQMTNFKKEEMVTLTQTDSRLGIAGGDLNINEYSPVNTTHHFYYFITYNSIAPFFIFFVFSQFGKGEGGG